MRDFRQVFTTLHIIIYNLTYYSFIRIVYWCYRPHDYTNQYYIKFRISCTTKDTFHLTLAGHQFVSLTFDKKQG